MDKTKYGRVASISILNACFVIRFPLQTIRFNRDRQPRGFLKFNSQLTTSTRNLVVGRVRDDTEKQIID